MSILAEPRRKQKIAIDPQNSKWRANTDSFAQKMMKGMGWNEEKGLGKNKQGMTTNLKLNVNYTQKGLGNTVNMDKTWVGHHDDFASILANLNKSKKDAKIADESGDEEEDQKVEVVDLDSMSRLSKRRIHYPKYIKRKDLSQATDLNKFQIFGRRVEGAVKKEVQVKEEEFVAKAETSGVSATNYFEAKLAAIQARKMQAALDEQNGVAKKEVDEDGSEKLDGQQHDESTFEPKVRKSKKRKMDGDEKEQLSVDESPKAKVKKGNSCSISTIKEEVIEEEKSDDNNKIKRKKKAKVVVEDQEDFVEIKEEFIEVKEEIVDEDGGMKLKKSKKEKKKRNQE
uniref:G-patch domain-containing protein n=1 Tax=Rhabditophanes sp. KR3021 TaxID=114890 RepID=A0AC35TVA6_9BILA